MTVVPDSPTTSLMLRAEADHNGATYPASTYAVCRQKLWNSSNAIYEDTIGTTDQFRETLLKTETVFFLTLTAHGDPKSISLGPDSDLTPKNVSSVFKAAKFHPDATIALIACCKGGTNSVAKKINEVAKVRVVAAENGECGAHFLLRSPKTGDLQPFLLNLSQRKNLTVTYTPSGKREPSSVSFKDVMTRASEQMYPEAIQWCFENLLDPTGELSIHLPDPFALLQSMVKDPDYRLPRVYEELIRASYERGEYQLALDYIKDLTQNLSIKQTLANPDLAMRLYRTKMDCLSQLTLLLERQAVQ